MQTPITDKIFFKSAHNLDNKRLHAAIYENIHGLASILDCVDDLQISEKAKIQVKKYKNKPQCKMWIGYEKDLLYYIYTCLCEWGIERNFKLKINLENYNILAKKMFVRNFYNYKCPSWITDELIQTHRSVLIQKEIKQEYKLNYDIDCLEYDEDITQCQKIELQNKLYKKISRHYRNLWPDCSMDLKMRYDWRK